MIDQNGTDDTYAVRLAEIKAQGIRCAEFPLPGYYRTRLVRGGVDVGCRIVESDGLWVLLINGAATCPAAQRDPWKVPKMHRIADSWTITEAEYDALMHAASTARPGEPAADPSVPVNWRDAPSLY